MKFIVAKFVKMEQLTENILFAGRYRLLEVKGRGSFGEVWRAMDEKLQSEVAVKVYIALDPKGLEEFVSEYKVANTLSHPNLLHADYFDVWDNRPFIVMPYCPESSASLVGKMDEKTAWRFLCDVSGGLAYLHGKGIIHRDIKPDNILRDKEGRFLISDFGISTKMRSTLRRNSTRLMDEKNDLAGTVGYMAPELFSSKPAAVNATDIWALGASLCELLTGEMPFMGQGGVMLLHGAEMPELEDKYSRDLQTMLEACMSKDTWERPTAEQLQLYVEAKLRGETPTKTWKSGNVSEKRDETLKPKQEDTDNLQGNQTVASSVGNVAGGSKKAEAGSGRKEDRKRTSGWIWVIVLLVVFAAGILLWQNKQNQAKQEAQERIAWAERARQDSLANALAEAQRKVREAEESYRKAEQEQEEARKQWDAEAKAEQERLAQQERQRQEEARKQRDAEAKVKAEQERLAQQERQRQEDARKQREAEARRRATSNQIIRVGNVEFEMVYVEGGTFLMGATKDQGDDAYFWEKPNHAVTLSSYRMGKYEVTQALWEEVMGRNPSKNKQGGKYPVENVSWNDCQKFIEKLNARTGLKFRLPTEAEWEYAARGGNKSKGYKYAGSDDLDEVGWYRNNSNYKFSYPVGSKKPNELGIYDMSGNILEWCQDKYGRYSNRTQTNPIGAVDGRYRVLRGGGTWSSAKDCRVSNRISFGPSEKLGNGLRLALDCIFRSNVGQ